MLETRNRLDFFEKKEEYNYFHWFHFTFVFSTCLVDLVVIKVEFTRIQPVWNYTVAEVKALKSLFTFVFSTYLVGSSKSRIHKNLNSYGSRTYCFEMVKVLVWNVFLVLILQEPFLITCTCQFPSHISNDTSVLIDFKLQLAWLTRILDVSYRLQLL